MLKKFFNRFKKKSEESKVLEIKENVINKDEKIVDTLDEISIEKEELKLENGYLSITDDIFKHDTIVLENQNISKISLCDHNKKVYVTVESNCPLYGIWGSNPGTPFVCIEPWFGAFDHENFCKTIADKEYENALEPEKIYENFYKITLD